MKKESAIDAAMKHITHRDRSAMEIKEHLKKKEYEQEEIQDAVDYLLHMKYIDDKDYAQRYAQYTSQKGKGIIKVKNDLTQKGISEEIIRGVLEDDELFSRENERERAFNQAEKIICGLPHIEGFTEDDDYETKTSKYKEFQRIRGKIGRRLIGLGYSQDVVFSVTDEILHKFYKNLS